MAQKGFNPVTGGYSKSTMELLTTEQRALFNDEGLYLDGTKPKELPELEFAGKTNQDLSEKPKEEQAQELSVPISQVEELVKKMLSEQLANQKPIEQPRNLEILAGNKSSDDLPELRDWEIKNRTYVLLETPKAIAYNLQDRHKPKSPLMYHHPETNEDLALMYTTSSTSFLKKNHPVGQDMYVTPIVFKGVVKEVPASDIKLQKFLRIHPANGIIFKEHDPAVESKKALEMEDLQFRAMELARKANLTKQTAIARVMCRNFSESWESDEIRLNLFSKVKESPDKFIKLANDDMIEMKGFIMSAKGRGFLKYTNYTWLDDENQVLKVCSPNENEVDALAAYFTTNQGRETYDWIKNRI